MRQLRITWPAMLGRLLAATVLGLVAPVALAAVPAAASCAAPPVESPNSFTGTVVATENSGRVAVVVLDNGGEVTVIGGPDEGSATSVDRSYVRGGRYEFHPLNARSPFEDNACTATRQLAGPRVGEQVPARDRLPGWLPVDEQAGPVVYAAVAAIGLGAVALVAMARLAGGHRRTRTGTEAFQRSEGHGE